MTSILASSLILIAMGCIFATLSLVLSRKSHSLTKISKNLSPKVFETTFNVFNPFPEHRNTITDNVGVLILCTAIMSLWLIPLTALKILELEFLLSFVTIIICLNLLMLDDLLETWKQAKIFENAIRNVANLAPGDLDVLLALKRIVPKLSIYYISLAIVFFSSSLTMPYIVSTLSIAVAHFLSASFMFAFYMFIPIAPVFTVLSLTVAAVAITSAFSIAKSRIFGFSSLERPSYIEEQFNRMKLFVRVMHHHPTLRVPEPEDT